MAANVPPAPGAKKKGLHPLAWVAIGCVGLIVLGGILTVATGVFVAKKAKEVLTEGDPAMTAAETIVRLNPQLELVESDEAEGTITIRDKDSGKTATFDIAAIREGRFEFEADGERVEIDVSGDDGDGVVHVTTQSEGGEKESVLQIGSGGGDIPNWLPVYPGTDPQSAFSMNADGVASGLYQAETDDDLDDVIAFYGRLADDLGMEVDRSTLESGGQRVATIGTENYDSAERGFNVVVTERDGSCTIVVHHRAQQN